MVKKETEKSRVRRNQGFYDGQNGRKQKRADDDYLAGYKAGLTQLKRWQEKVAKCQS